jgi:argininosuccinate lyase
MHAFNQSLKYDKRMQEADIRGSIAYAKALSRVGILTEGEREEIVDGLTAVGKEWEDGVVSLRGSTKIHLVSLIEHCSSKFRRTMKTSTQPTNVD